MKGDKNKTVSSFGRWVDHFWDGFFNTNRKGSRRVPSQHHLKKYEKKWKRRLGKKELKREEKDYYNE